MVRQLIDPQTSKPSRIGITVNKSCIEFEYIIYVEILAIERTHLGPVIPNSNVLS